MRDPGWERIVGRWILKACTLGKVFLNLVASAISKNIISKTQLPILSKIKFINVISKIPLPTKTASWVIPCLSAKFETAYIP